MSHEPTTGDEWARIEADYNVVIPLAPWNIFTMILQQITEHPEQWDQRYWHHFLDKDRDGPGVYMGWRELLEYLVDKNVPTCKTKHCFAGWGVWLVQGLREVEKQLLPIDRFDSEDLFNASLEKAGRERVRRWCFMESADKDEVLEYIRGRTAEEVDPLGPEEYA